MRQDLDKIENVYDSVAKEYAATFFGEHEKKPKDQELLVRFSKEIGGRRPVWEFGCGPGHTTKYLNDLGVEVSGMDLSGKMLEQARMQYPGLQFRKGNILELDFKDCSIAAVLAFYAIVHFKEEQVRAAFGEVFRALEPGGLFLCTYHVGDETIHVEEFLGKKVNVDFMFFTSDFIFNSLKNSGFGRIEVIEREPYPEVEYQSRRAYIFATK